MKNRIIVALALAMGISGGISVHAKENKKLNIDLVVTENGFEPNSINVKPGTEVVLKVTRKTDATCATKIHVPSQKVKADLPLNKTITVALGKLEKGEIRFACGMNMIEGKVLVK